MPVTEEGRPREEQRGCRVGEPRGLLGLSCISGANRQDQERESAGTGSDSLSFPIFLCLFPKMTIMIIYSFYVERNNTFYFEEAVIV